MDDHQLIEYIKAEHVRNISHQVIYDNLVSAGWTSEKVTKAFLTLFGYIHSIKPLQLPSIDYLLAESIRLLITQWKVLITIAFIPNLYDIIFWIITKVAFPAGTTLPIYLNLSIIFIRYLLRIWSSGTLIYCIVQRNSNLEIKEAITQSWHYMLNFFWTSILLTISIFIGTLLLIIPGILLADILALTPYIFFEENIIGLEALKKSYFYIKGYIFSSIWRIIGLVTTTLLLTGFISGPIKAIILTLITPFSVIYIYLIYQKLKEIKSI